MEAAAGNTRMDGIFCSGPFTWILHRQKIQENLKNRENNRYFYMYYKRLNKSIDRSQGKVLYSSHQEKAIQGVELQNKNKM